MNGTVRILQMLPTLQRRGLEKVVTDIAIGLHGPRYQIDVCCQKESGSFAQTLAESGIEVICLEERGPRDLRAAIRLQAILKKKRYDIFHWHCPTAVGYQIPVVLATGVRRTILTFHMTRGMPGPPAVSAKLAGVKICTRLLSGGVDWIYGCSNAVLKSQLASGWPRRRSSVIYNGIDLAPAIEEHRPDATMRRLGIPSDAIVIGCVGALCHVKGQRYLIEALSLLLNRIPSAYLMLVGTGADLDALKDQVERLGCAGAVLFLGERHDVKCLLNVMDVFALPSLAEGLPLALIEAMASGVPVVASNVGGVSEAVKDGEDGLLVPSCNPAALADAIFRVCKDEELTHSMRIKAAQTVATRFHTSRMLKEVSDLYERVLDPTQAVS